MHLLLIVCTSFIITQLFFLVDTILSHNKLKQLEVNTLPFCSLFIFRVETFEPVLTEANRNALTFENFVITGLQVI